MAHIHSVYDTDNHFKVDAITRKITDVSNSKTSLVQGDHNSERFTFEIPRYIEGHDMLTCNEVQVHYLNIEKAKKYQKAGIYVVEDLQESPESEDVVICSWLISGNATKYVGSLNFLLRFVCRTDEDIDYAWNTAIHPNIAVAEGIYNGDEIIAEYPDILEQWRKELMNSGIGGVSIPNGAQVGQIIQVAKVDGNGKPTEWKASNPIAVSAELDEEHVAHFKNSLGVVLFSVDLSGLGVPLEYGDLVLSAESLTIAEGSNGTFKVKLASAPSVKQTVYLAMSDSTRMTVSPASLVFTPDNWATEQTVTLTALQDEDMDDDSITVTLTSKNVDGKSLVVTLSDDDKPTLVMDGLVLNLDYTGQTENISNIIADTVYGVEFKNFAAANKLQNGIYGSSPALVSTTGAWENVITALKNGQGFTLEHFGTIFQNTFLRNGENNDYVINAGYNYGINCSDGTGSADFNAKPSTVLQDGTTETSSLSIIKEFTIDGVTVKPNKAAVWNQMRMNEFLHIVFTFSPEGTVEMWINGYKSIHSATVENFASWDFDNMFGQLGMWRVYSDNENNYTSMQRIYNKVLSEEEVVQNMEYNLSKWGLATF